jgi:hypothetical protein
MNAKQRRLQRRELVRFGAALQRFGRACEQLAAGLRRDQAALLRLAEALRLVRGWPHW